MLKYRNNWDNIQQSCYNIFYFIILFELKDPMSFCNEFLTNYVGNPNGRSISILWILLQAFYYCSSDDFHILLNNHAV